MGVLDPQPLGLEGAGTIEEVGSEVTDLQKGDRVFFIECGALSTCVKIPASSCIKIPLDLSLEEAATMPCVYATAIHCLMDLGRLREGESVLIHSACGGKTPARIILQPEHR
jgi:NADPH:quinone reductase-like Zn-dependent oxidoreductase